MIFQKERVLQLFENYRREWRNKSAHDYKLLFDKDEVFIALMNVSSFVHLILKKIQEKIDKKTNLTGEIIDIIKDPSDNLTNKTLKLIEKIF